MIFSGKYNCGMNAWPLFPLERFFVGRGHPFAAGISAAENMQRVESRRGYTNLLSREGF